MYSKIPLEIEHYFLQDSDCWALIRYSHVGQQARRAVQAKLNSRCTKMLLQFFNDNDLAPFWDAMNRGRGGVTGSGPLWMSQSQPSWSLHNLNTVVTNARMGPARTFFASRGWKEELVPSWIPEVNTYRDSDLMTAHDHSSTYVDRTWQYSKHNRPTITLTETADRSVFRHIASARHTLATMLLTSTSMIALHPDEFIRSVCIRRGSWAPDWQVLNSVMARVTECGGSDSFLESINGPCGRRCPGLLRRLRGGKSIGLLLWNGASYHPDSSRAVTLEGRSDVDFVAMDAYSGFAKDEYALGWTWARCVNTPCQSYLFPRNCLVPRGRATPAHTNPKDARIFRTEEAIRRCVPSFPRLYKGILFPTSSGRPVVVSVPLDHGIDTYHSIDDLRTQAWITPRIRNIEPYPIFMPPHNLIGATTIFNALSWTETVGSGCALLICMTAIHDIGPSNRLLGECCLRPVHGDVLLLLETKAGLQDVDMTDAPMLKQLFERVWNSKVDETSLGTYYKTSLRVRAPEA
ncbi:hypothetical protein C8F04DRAFT_1260996 [Mycena alexandri]|uniref:Uncharacterized protein n=1 Tax=Mycena alexandri TaxID=1745969 RepID=A0AAD6X2P9_9AGAR|nr:hypothetical protein C8F04DRAFT_1260996 [Mycena alexandri]